MAVITTPAPRTVEVGLYFDLRNPLPWHRSWSGLYSATLELCEEADRLGVHSLWFTEHHLFEDGYLTQPLTFAAAAAARTGRARIGTAVTMAPFRSPVHLAEEAAVVDLISDGRLELGLGAGYRRPEFELFGADFAQRFDATDRCARLVRQLWSTGRLSPPPAQPDPSIWMGYGGPRGARRAGLLGESLLSSDPALVEPYRAGLREAGLPPESARMAGLLSGFISDDPERDWPIVRRHLTYQWDSYRRYAVEGTGGPPPAPVDVDAWRERGVGARSGHFLHATPEDAAKKINRYVSGTPIETVWLFASIAGMPHEMAARHIGTVVTRLAPLLRGD